MARTPSTSTILPEPGSRAGRVLATGALAASILAARAAHAEPSPLPPEVGWNGGDVETGRTVAMGGASRALGPDISGLHLNPASMAASRVYHLAALAQIWPEARRQTYGAAAVDSVTSRVAGGLSGSYTQQDPDGLKRKATDVRLALAFPASDKLFIGATGKYLKLRQDGLGPLGSSYASGGHKNDTIVSGFTFDAGITAHPTNMLWIGLVGTNLTNAGDGFRPLGLGGGIGVATSDFTIEGDVAADFTTFDKTKLKYMGGAELLAADRFPIRAGYRYEEGLKSHALSGGVGYLDQSWGIELSVRRVVSPFDSTTVVIGLQYFLESSGLTRGVGDGD